MKKGSTFQALHYRDFRLLWVGLVVSNAGTWMQMVAQGWLIYELTGSTFYLGLVGLMQAIPRFTFSLLAGVAADHLDRKRLLYLTQTSSMILAFLLAALTYAGIVRVWHILAISFLNSLVMTFDQPTRQVMIPGLVKRQDMANAIALNSMAFNGAAVFGPSLGGLLLAIVGAAGCFFLNGVSYLAVLFALYFMHVPAEEGNLPTGHTLGNDIAEGLSAFRHNRLMTSLLVLTIFLSFFGRPYNQLMPAFAKDILRVGPQGLGLLMMAPGIGTVIGSLTLASLGSEARLSLLTVMAMLGFAIALICFSWTHIFVLALFFLLLVGLSQTMAMATINTLLQTTAEPEVRGRVISMYTMLNMGLTPLGALPSGALATSWGPSLVVSGGGFMVAAVTLLTSIRVPELWRRVAGQED